MGLTRREFMATGLAASAVGMFAAPAIAAPSYFSGTAVDGNVRYRATNFNVIDPKWRRQVVQYHSSEPFGTVVIDTSHHFLYLTIENKTAIRYGISVGKEGFKWYGRAIVARKTTWPRWTPPPEMLERNPKLPKTMAGGADNPLGARAMYLHSNGGDTGYRIHGTTSPSSIGRDASSGCIRMFNEDAMDLYQRCPVGTAVLVLPHIADQAPKG